MNTIKKLQPYTIFIFLWLIINILQAAFTELTSDEGYYWFYARTLEWGYYDHPPMVALMIRAGSYLFKGTLGVRFFNVLFSTGAVWLFLELLPSPIKNSRKVFLLLLSCPLFNYLTFIVFPDGPLLFFSLLYLFIYKKFIERPDWRYALLSGICMALMFYSKYHGVLVVFFTLLANIRLLRSPYFYLSCLLASLLFIPHLLWQYQHHFITLGYHLSGRTDPLSMHHVLEYISQQIPAIGPGLVFIPFVYKTRDRFERTLQFIIIGTFIFFLGSSLKTFVHFHWTSIALFPIILLAANYFENNNHSKLFKWLIIPFVLIVLLVRLQLLFSFLPVNHANVDYYKGRDLWALDIKRVAGKRPVLFPNNLREASLYSFYSGSTGITMYGREEKKTQYDLWNYEDSLQNREVVFAAMYPYPGSTELPTRMGQTLYYKIIPAFKSYYDHVPISSSIKYYEKDSVIICSLRIKNERNDVLNFDRDSEGYAPVLIYTIENDNFSMSDTLNVFNNKDQLKPGATINANYIIPIKTLPPGGYKLLFGIRYGVIPEAYNSNELRIKK